MSRTEGPACPACGKTVNDSRVTPADVVITEAEAAAVGLDDVVWVCGDCYRLMQTLYGSGVDGD